MQDVQRILSSAGTILEALGSSVEEAGSGESSGDASRERATAAALQYATLVNVSMFVAPPFPVPVPTR